MNGKSSTSSSSHHHHQSVIMGSPAAAAAAAVAAHNTSSSLKSSVKRLFSPKHSGSSSSSSVSQISKNQIITAPSGLTTTSSRVVVGGLGKESSSGLLMTSKPRSLVMTSSKSKQESIGGGGVMEEIYDENGLCSLGSGSVSGGMSSLNDNTLSSCNGIGGGAAGSSLLSTASKSSHSITASSSVSSKSKATNTNEILQPRATSTLKKGLNLLKTNSKKVLMGSSNSSNNSSSASNSPRKQQQQGMSSSIKTGSPTSSTQSTTTNNEYDQRMSDLVTQSRDIQSKCGDLQAEIDRLSRLYDYEVGNRVKCEEKLSSLKQAYEERQIESAACKYEYRKLLDLKETLHVENQCLKQALVNYQNSRSNTPSTNNNDKSKQQLNHTTSSSSSLTSASNTTTTTTPRTINHHNSIVQLISGHQVENDGGVYSRQQQQPGSSFNRSMSPVSAAAGANNSSPQSSQSNMTTKQQQQAANATAQAAAAAADYFEQQFKAQQHKSQELEQQLCICIDQNKELKQTVDNLSELNRKFFEENQQLKERAMSQRDQIDQYHMLFDENKSEADQLRDELNRVYERETDLKRQNMQLMSQIQCGESTLAGEVARLKQSVEQEKSRAELFEKKLKMLERESSELLEQERSEKSESEIRLRCQSDERIKQERARLEEKFGVERDEFRRQVSELEHKLEEVIKEKAQLAFKYGQLADTNRDLNSMVKNSQVFNEKKVEETNNKLEFYINKCNELEKEIAECQETHARDTDEWKKFQADLQTAVRVANDFMMEAEEKVNKMKEDYMKIKEREQGYVEEIDRLKTRLGLMETNSRIIQATTRQNSTIESSSSKLSTAQLLRESDILSKSQQSTDTDDAKQIMLSSSSSNSQRVRTNSSSSSSTASSLSNQDIMSQQSTSANVYNKSTTLVASSTTNNNTDALATLVKMYDGVSKRNALIKWCQDRLGDYKGIDIKNFSSSWNDGLAFCALLHSFLPHRIDYDSLRVEANPRKNFLTAFTLAQSVGIEQTLSLNDVLNHERPEWNSIMNYVTLIYKHFHHLGGHNSDEEKANLISSSGMGSSSSTSSSSSSSPIRSLHSTASAISTTTSSA